MMKVKNFLDIKLRHDEAHASSVELGLSIREISFVIGHTQEVHNQNYARFILDEIDDKVSKQLAA